MNVQIRLLGLLGILLLMGGCALIPETPTEVKPTQSIPQAKPTITSEIRTPTDTVLQVTPSPTPTSRPLPSKTPVPTPTVCLDEAATALTAATRQAPLEVRYISKGNLWAWQEQVGEATQISDTADAQSFSFSPDGQVIAFTRGEPNSQTELWAINRDGTGLRRLVTAGQLHAIVGDPTTSEFEYTDEVHYIDWLDGARALGFEVLRSYNAIGGCCDSGGTWQFDLASGQFSPWTPSQEIQNARNGLVSPDGSQVALVGETGLTLVNADGANRREEVLTYAYVPQMEGGGFIAPSVTWAADSQSLIAITYSENFWEPGATFTTWRVPVAGAPAQRLHTFSGFPFSPKLSPEQRYLAYRSPVEPMSNDWELHLATLDGSRDVVYAQGQLMDFWGWAPDGVRFVFGQGTNRALSLGSVCGAAQSLLDPPISPIWQFTWVDPDRFVFISGGDAPIESELRLGTVGDESVLIGSHRGEYATYQIKPDQETIGVSR